MGTACVAREHPGLGSNGDVLVRWRKANLLFVASVVSLGGSGGDKLREKFAVPNAFVAVLSVQTYRHISKLP